MSGSKPINIDAFSVCAVPMAICLDDAVLGRATGFWFEKAARFFLVSNWHVFSGREPSNGQPKDQTGFRIPNNLKLSYYPASSLNHQVEMMIRLDDDSPTWIQHKVHGQRIDVAAKEVYFNERAAPTDIDMKPFTINGTRQVDDLLVTVSSDVFVLGFPLGIMKTGLLPVWKRASVATEMEIDVNDLPSFVIDTATREGMSGSPVIARSFGGYAKIGGGGVLGAGVYNKFLGVYSGRYIGGLDEAHLGIVWKARVIEEIIDDPAPGDFEIH